MAESTFKAACFSPHLHKKFGRGNIHLGKDTPHLRVAWNTVVGKKTIFPKMVVGNNGDASHGIDRIRTKSHLN